MSDLPMEIVEAVCRDCDIERCERLLDRGFDVNTRNDQGVTMLMLAVEPDQYGDFNSPRAIRDLVAFLIERGANPGMRDKNGWTAQDYARQYFDPQWRTVFGDKIVLDDDDARFLTDIILLLESV